ncbi:MAG: GUN4 domain-containing protein, partial [Synechococcales bacterium]|nr:GUN4 domain-containing protein [Synechococcales bacterium]
MAERTALLIGTGAYDPDHFKPLEAVPRNLEVLSQVLRDPKLGGFDRVEPLLNPDRSQVELRLETWLRERSKEDFLLLYWAGHGIKDAQRHLYFATKNSQKLRNELLGATAVSATTVHQWLRSSKAQSQIVILDCCFSGAFGDLLAQDDGSVQVEEVFPAVTGRVVLTSSSSTQYSFQKRGGELSIYTHFLVEGIRTGAADLDEDGTISADELHEYASRKVQSESTAMTPKIIVMKDQGYRLRVANTLRDPIVKYRQEVEKIVEEDGGEIDEVLSRRVLHQQRIKLGISEADALTIEQAVLEPIQRHREKLLEYEQAIQAVVARRSPNDRDMKRLKQLQNLLGLSEQDVAETTAKAMQTADLRPPDPPPATHPEPTIGSAPPANNPTSLHPRYTQLATSLKAGNWKKADQETSKVMLEVAGQTERGYLDREDLENFPCEDLLTIDRLWVEASDGHFGFSVQKKIWEKCGSPMDYNDDYKKFCE